MLIYSERINERYRMGHKRLVEADQSASYPSFLKKIHNSSKSQPAPDPVVIKMDKPDAQKQLQTLIKNSEPQAIVDNYAEQYAELLLSKNAHLYRANHEVQVDSIKNLLDEHYGKADPWTLGAWSYFPWSGQLIHVLNQEDFEDLRTIRNRELITKSEQATLLDFSAACFGMSVGSAGALALAISGISRKIKLIDGAVISGSNLNRILTGVESVGTSKAEVIGRKIYEMNPYAQIYRTDKVTAENIETILDGNCSTNLVIDEIDDIEMKVRLRIEARKRKIPVIMASELGDTVILDVERYDLEPNRPLFHNAIPDIEEVAKNPPENHREWMKYAVKILDPKNMPIKLQKSLLKIGSTVVTHPQLGATVMMTGGILAFAAKNIALGGALESGRYTISLENMLLADHGTRKHKRAHKKHTKVISSAMQSM